MPIDVCAIQALELHSPVDLTLADRRLYNYLLHHAMDRPKNALKFTLALDQLQGVFNAGTPSTDRLQQALRRLLGTTIGFSLRDKKKWLWYATTLLADAELDMAQEKLTFCFSTSARLLLTEPILLERCLIQAHFTYKYSALLYELLAQEYYQGHTTFYVETETLRSRLRIEPGKMPNFSDLNRFVLQPALTEINTYAGFIVQYTVKNKGRKIIGLDFHCQSKSKQKIRSSKEVIPPRRPRLFIESPEEEYAYAYLLNADIATRQSYFSLAKRRALQAGTALVNHDIDQPDRWYRFILKDLLEKLRK